MWGPCAAGTVSQGPYAGGPSADYHPSAEPSAVHRPLVDRSPPSDVRGGVGITSGRLAPQEAVAEVTLTLTLTPIRTLARTLGAPPLSLALALTLGAPPLSLALALTLGASRGCASCGGGGGGGGRCGGRVSGGCGG